MAVPAVLLLLPFGLLFLLSGLVINCVQVMPNSLCLVRFSYCFGFTVNDLALRDLEIGCYYFIVGEKSKSIQISELLQVGPKILLILQCR